MPVGGPGSCRWPDDNAPPHAESGVMTDHRSHLMSSGSIGLLVLLCSCAAGGTSDTSARSVTPADDASLEGDRPDVERFCDSYLAADALVGPALSAGGEAMAEVRDAFAGLSAVPSELEGPLTVMREQVAFLVGDSVTEPPEEEFDMASVQVTDWVIGHCELIPWEITAIEYSFGTPETLQPGSYEIRLANRGEEFHEAQIVQIDDDVDMSLADLLQLDEPELLDRVTPLTGVFAAPGDADRQILTLTEEGRYGIVCLVPVGSTAAAIESDVGVEPAGPPHFTEGMFVEFVVSA
jgi:hypothetical protein